MTPLKTRVLIADDHPIALNSLRAVLDAQPGLVERHRANILDKLGMRDRVELTRYAIRRGLIEP
jgi:DNA-binding NarL/FixJ family response regulator